MRTPICDQLGIEYPIFGFTPSPEVCVAISKAGGLGVLGAVRFSDPKELGEVLDWIDANIDGKPYGVDVVMPHSYIGNDALPDLESMIDDRHRAFVEEILARHGVPDLPEEQKSAAITGWMHTVARELVEVSLEHPIALIANALGPPPPDVIAKAKAKGVLVAALAGKAKHAQKHVAAGVDIIVAQGHEAGGHCGDVTTMVLAPEVVEAVGDTPVLVAGGIGTGAQAAAALALGGAGVWLGSLWLACKEFQIEPQQENGLSVVKEKLLRATSSDTVRSKVISGKPARMLKTAWTEAWLEEEGPGTLGMPLQGMLVADAEARIRHHQSKELMGVPVGQIVGQMNEERTVAELMQTIVRDFDRAAQRIDRARTPPEEQAAE